MNSGILHPIYLIEEHGGISHSKLDGAILDQAITNTQVYCSYLGVVNYSLHALLSASVVALSMLH